MNDNYITIDRIYELLKNPTRRCVDNKLQSLKGQSVLIYGAGSYGKEVYDLLSDHGITVSAFLDRNAHYIDKINNTEIYTLEEYPGDRNVTIFFSIVCGKSIREGIINELKENKYTCIVESQSIRCLMVDFSAECHSNADTIIDNIKSAYNLMSDDKSRDIFLNNIYAHLSGDYSRCADYEDETNDQYFPQDIDEMMDYSVFVDCGGFIGDTVQAVMERYRPETIVSFEPNIDNYIRLSQTCDELNTQTKFILYNNAVSDTVSQQHFQSGTGSGKISENGDKIINTVSIDKAFYGIHPTFIKMDIEGAEIDALNGAERTIHSDRPTMAVCVYHNIDHIWRIPLLLNKINNGYRFYLRSYNSYTMETVLYAIDGSR